MSDSPDSVTVQSRFRVPLREQDLLGDSNSVALPPQTTIALLIAGPIRLGKLKWIGLRPSRNAPMVVTDNATLVAHQGIEGDRYRTQRDGPRQVTLIASEDIEAIAAFLGRSSISPELLRRNLVTSGINLHALKGHAFRVGAVVLEATGDCAPCSRMEANLGPGGYNAVSGRGGLTARVIEGGIVTIGSAIERLGGGQT